MRLYGRKTTAKAEALPDDANEAEVCNLLLVIRFLQQQRPDETCTARMGSQRSVLSAVWT